MTHMSNEKFSPQQLTETNESIYGEESFSMKGFTAGAIVGALIGAAAALLYAPKPGADVRQSVASQASTLKEKSVDLTSATKDKAAQLTSQIKEQSTQLVDKVKAKTSSATEDAEEAIEEVEVEQVADAAEEAVEDFTATIGQKADATIEEVVETVEDTTKA